MKKLIFSLLCDVRCGVWDKWREQEKSQIYRQSQILCFFPSKLLFYVFVLVADTKQWILTMSKVNSLACFLVPSLRCLLNKTKTFFYSFTSFLLLVGQLLSVLESFNAATFAAAVDFVIPSCFCHPPHGPQFPQLNLLIIECFNGFSPVSRRTSTQISVTETAPTT